MFSQLEQLPLDITKTIIDFGKCHTLTFNLMTTSKRMYSILTHPKLYGSLIDIFMMPVLNRFFQRLTRHQRLRKLRSEHFPYDSHNFFHFMVKKTNAFMVTSMYPDKYRFIFANSLAHQNTRIILELMTHPQVDKSATMFKRFYKQCIKGRIDSVKCLLKHPRLNPHSQKGRILKTMINERNEVVSMLLLEDLFKRMNSNFVSLSMPQYRLVKLLGEMVCLSIYCFMDKVTLVLLECPLVKSNYALDVTKLYLKARANGIDAVADILYEDNRVDKDVVGLNMMSGMTVGEKEGRTRGRGLKLRSKKAKR